MRATTLVQPTADIVTIVSLQTGDVYKRLEKDYANQYSVNFGVVQDVMHNGEDAVITALEFTSSYSGVEPKLKVFGGDSELKLFVAQPDEVRAHLDELVEAADRSVETAKRELDKRREIANRVAVLIEQTAAQALTAPATSMTALAN